MTGKTRLEEINRNVLYIKKNSLAPNEVLTWSGWQSILPIFTKDLEYLHEQAERVQELEKRNDELEEVFKKYKKANKDMYNLSGTLKFENLKLEQQNQLYREALESMLAEAKDHKEKGLRIQHWALIKDLEKALKSDENI